MRLKLSATLSLFVLLVISHLVRAEGPGGDLPSPSALSAVQREFLTQSGYSVLQPADLPLLQNMIGVLGPAHGGLGTTYLPIANTLPVSNGYQWQFRMLQGVMVDPIARSGTGNMLITGTFSSLSDGDIPIYDAATNNWINGSAASGSAHNLLDSTVHLDTFTSSPIRGDLIVAIPQAGIDTWTALNIGPANAVLVSDGTDATWDPNPQVDSINSINGFLYNGGATTGTLLRGNGTYYIPTTATYPNTTTQYGVLYSFANNAIGEIATATEAVLATDVGGVPAFRVDITLNSINLTEPTISLQTVGDIVSLTLIDGSTVNASTGFTRAGAAATGTILRGNGTVYVPSTATYPNTTTANRILYSSSASVIGEIATAASSVLVTDGSSVPSLSTTLPSGLTIPGYATSGANSSITSLSGLTGAIAKPTTITFATGGAIRTDTSAGNTLLLQAYDVDGTAYTTFGTLTANNTPTFDLSTATTIGGNAFYYVGGTDVAITDGGTGAGTATTAFNNLSPVTTRGDIIVRGATNNDRLGLGSTGKILRSDGTDLVYSTATYPGTTSANRILYSSSANVVGEITTANSSVLVTDGSGVPSLSTDLPAATTLGTLAITTLSSTTTFTNKTYDVEGTNNVFTIVDEVFLHGATMTATGAATWADFNWTDEATAAVPTGTNQSDIDLPYLSFSASATAAAVIHYRLPASWVGTIDITLVWDPTAATSGDVKWQFQSAYGTGTNPAFNSAQTVTTTVSAAVDTTSTLTGLDVTGASAGEMMYILVERLGADAADTCTGVARLKGATLKIRRQL